MDDLTIVYIVSGVVAIIFGIIFGCITRKINENKGYDGGFAWGFWLGWIGLIVVACKPTLQTSSRFSFSNTQLQDMIRVEVKKELDRILTEESHRLSAFRVSQSTNVQIERLNTNFFIEEAKSCENSAELLTLWERKAPVKNDAVHKYLKEASVLEQADGTNNVSKSIAVMEQLLLNKTAPLTANTIKSPTISTMITCPNCHSQQRADRTNCNKCNARLHE